MKTYIIGEDSEMIIKPEYVEKESFLYADDRKIIMCKADPYEDSHLPVHIRLREKGSHDSTKWIDIVLEHKAQLAGLIKAFESYLSIKSDEDTMPAKPVITLVNPDCDTIRYECPVCGYEFMGYQSSPVCPRCRKTIDWGNSKPKIKKILYWEDEEDEYDE